ncbi:unnamed protein product, partial [Iphiclides podalirius]
MTDIVENEEVDKDTIDEIGIEQQFYKKYELLTETTVSNKKAYINKITGTKSLKYSITLPDNSIEVYELSNSALTRTCRLTGHEKKVTEVVFNPNDDNMLFSSSEDGIVKMWDTRAGGSFVHDYKDEEELMVRPYECMDVSHNGRVLCAGSQLVEEDAFLVFWDQRATKPLGGYWNSHTEDVTQVKFHKEKMEILATGSIDGLVNVFDITEQTEEDALTYSLNLGTALDRIAWLDHELAACTTQAHELQLWNLATGDRLSAHNRDDVARGIKRSRADDCYLVDAFLSAEGAPVLLAGSYGGCEDTLRSVRVVGRRLHPRTNFAGNRQIVHTCWYDRERDMLLTAGEAGVISVWRGLRCDREMEVEVEPDSVEEGPFAVDRAQPAPAHSSHGEPDKRPDSRPSSPPASEPDDQPDEPPDGQPEKDASGRPDSPPSEEQQHVDAVEGDAPPGKLSAAQEKLHANRHQPY